MLYPGGSRVVNKYKYKRVDSLVMKEKVLLQGYCSHSAARGLPGQPLKGRRPQGAGGRVQPAVEVDDC